MSTIGVRVTIPSSVTTLPGRLKAAARRGAMTLGQGGERIAKDHVSRPPASEGATGDLYRRIGPTRPLGECGAILDVLGGGSGQPFGVVAASVETGRKAGKRPPPSAMLPWATRIVEHGAYHGTKGKHGYSKTECGQADAKSLAFLVARKIGRAGTKAHPYMAPARAWIEANAVAVISAEIQKEIG